MTSRFFAKVGAAAVTGGTLVALAAAPASASGYDGTDPATTHCDVGAYTARSHPIYKGSTRIGLLELRYSPKCRTVWGRVTRMNLPTCGPNGYVEV